MYRMYVLTLRDGVKFNLVYIPDDVVNESKETFDAVFMSKLFDI